MNKKDYGVTKIYRLSNSFYKKKLYILSKLLKLFIRIIYSATIPYKCNIGYGTKFPHGGQGVVIHDDTIIGENCVISVNVVIGGKKGSNKVPIIGNNVVVGANSVIIGDVSIGDNSVIGAGSVVIKDVEKNSTVVGNPAHKVLRKD